MKKIYQSISIVLAVAAAVACQKVGDETVYSPDETLYRTGEVTLCLGIEDMTTKLAMDDLGHFLFAKGDSIAAVCADGTIFKMYLSGTGDTKRAIFKGTVPAGKSLGDVVVYPCSCLKSYLDGTACITLPPVQKYSAGYVCPMTGKIGGDDYKVQMKQAAACLRLSIKDFPEDVAEVVFSDADGNSLSGDFDCDIEGGGIAARKAEGDLKVILDGVCSKPQFDVCVPYGDYSALSVALYGPDGNELNTQRLSEGQLTFAKSSLKRMEIQSSYVVNTCKVLINGSQTEKFKEIAPGIWEAAFTAPASGEMTLFANGQECGFTQYSGAGGLGKCKNVNSALPYYSYTDAHTEYYNVGKAAGALYPVADGGFKFWLNMDAAAQVKVVMDLNYGSYGSYYLEVVKEDDPNVIIDEGFDLFTCGGDQTWYLKGTLYSPDASQYDGLMAGAKGKALWNASGSKKIMWDYPEKKVASIVANKTYIKNRGVEDWAFEQVDERPGGLQVSEGSIAGKITTPAFSRLTGTSDVRFTVEMNRYGANSSADICFTIKNGGKFKGGRVHQTEAADTDGNKTDAIDTDLTGLNSETYTVTTDYCMVHGSKYNTSIHKSVSTFELDIEGATPQTKIEIYPTSGNCRFMVYDIKVVKK